MDQLWPLWLVQQFQTSVNFWDKSISLVPQNASCELFVKQVPATSPFDKLFSRRELICELKEVAALMITEWRLIQ